MIYVSDHRRRAIVAIDSLAVRSGSRSFMAPAGIGALDQPSGLALSSDGLLAIADAGNGRVVVLEPSSNTWATLAPAVENIGRLLRPTGVAFGADGSLFVADQGHQRIVRASSIDAPEWTAYGVPGTAAPGGFVAPTGILIDAGGRIVVADPGANRLIRMDDMSGAGWTEIALPMGANPPRPYAVGGTPEGGVLVGDLTNARVLEVTIDNATRTRADGRMSRSIIVPIAVASTERGFLLADAGAARLTRWELDVDADVWTQTEQLVGVPGPAGGPEFSRLCGLAYEQTS